MDSDSDSDGSYVSATPPRNYPPPSPSPPPGTLLPSKASRITVKSISYSRPTTSKPRKAKNPPKQPQKSNPTPRDPHPGVSPKPSPLISLPFQIRHPAEQNSSVSMETLPAGFFSRRASFSRIQRPSTSFEPVSGDPSSSSVSILRGKAELGDYSGFGTYQVAAQVKNEVVGSENSEKVLKKHPNLIGASVPLPSVKLRKGSNEGNFVRLNLRGNKRKFLNKGKGNRNYRSGGRRPYKRSKRILKAEAGGGAEGVIDEDGLVTETVQTKSAQEHERLKVDRKLVEEAVMEVQNKLSDENLERLLKCVYGYKSFRNGQLEAIKMVLDGDSTMLVLPTGAGKSLCYQIPAMIFSGITLVVSPLVALMIDQLKQLPPVIQGGLLCSSQMPEEVSDTMRRLRDGTIKVLYVSPERFLNAEFLSIFSSNLSISLVVVDEAHCISEWSHNFRPSYMRLRASVLRATLKAKCILAMTATSTTTTLHSIMSALEIPPNNLVQKAQLRDNLQLSVSLSGNRMKDLLRLMKSSPFKDVHSIIIYCKFQSETDTLSKYLSDNNISAKSYHSGIPAKERRRTQDLFCSNKIRVVVATVAFGMGLDKSDVGAVIHYSLPESLEEYVQEIGRAGRDGSLSYCHLFFDDNTYFKLRSLMYSDGVDEYAVNRFLSQIFTNDTTTQGNICSLVKESAARKYDMKEEVMLTILTHLELGEVQYLCMLPQLNVTCTLNFHETSPALLAQKDMVIAAILKMSETRQGQYVFDIPTVANSIKFTASEISNQLQHLKLMGEITYELKDPAYCYTIVKVPDDLCSLTAQLTRWLSEVESCQVQKLDAMYDAAVFAVNSCDKTNVCHDAQHTPWLQKKIMDYFMGDDNFEILNKIGQSSPFLRADIKVFLQSNSQAKFTPRAIARIMHGIASPAYPSTVWSKSHFWGRYTQIDFKVVMEAAKAELINFVGKGVQ